jgi:hypothetical protein
MASPAIADATITTIIVAVTSPKASPIATSSVLSAANAASNPIATGAIGDLLHRSLRAAASSILLIAPSADQSV